MYQADKRVKREQRRRKRYQDSIEHSKVRETELVKKAAELQEKHKEFMKRKRKAATPVTEKTTKKQKVVDKGTFRFKLCSTTCV